MRRLTIFLVTLAALVSVTALAGELAVFSNASDGTITRTYNDMGSFDAISSNGIGDIYFTQTTDGSSSLRIIGEAEYLEDVKVVVIEGVLTISGPNTVRDKSGKRVRIGGSFVSTNNVKLRIEVSAPTLKNLDVRGTGDVKIEDGLRVAKLSITNKGVGDVKINGLKAEELSVTLTGVGDVDLSGKADRASFSFSGVGSIEAYDLEVADLTVVSRGVGDVQCYATKSINVESRGVGNVIYKGSPKDQQLVSKGVGAVKNKK